MKRAALLLLCITRLAVAASCPTTTWFDTAKIDARCPQIPTTPDVFVNLPFAPGYLEASSPPARPHVDALKRLEKGAGLTFELTLPSGDPVRVPAQDVTVTSAGLTASFPLSAVQDPKHLRGVALIMPPNTLYCATTLVNTETRIEILFTDADGASTIITSCFPQAGPIDEAHANLGKIDNTPAGLALDFAASRRWEGVPEVHAAAGSWSARTGALKLTGSVPMNDATYHDVVTADLSYAKNVTYVGDAVNRHTRTAYWYTMFFRPETTVTGDQARDYVFGARTDMFLNLTPLFGSGLFRGRRPFLSLAFERVDPNKRENGTVPHNYNRGSASFRWKFYPATDFAVDATLAGIYILDKDRARELNLARWQPRLDVTLLVFADKQYKPFLKYTRGSVPPRFTLIKEALLGIAFDYPAKH